MQPVEIPSNESERLKKLFDYNILDSLEEEDYNNIVNLAAFICDTPIALISLVDKNRVWFKAKLGLEDREASRDIAFCSHAILKDELLIIPDTSKDNRFKENPLVTGPLEINFYTGAPILTSEGLAIGTLCVMDHKPRNLTEKQLDALKSLGKCLLSLLESRLRYKEREIYLKQKEEAEKIQLELKRQKELLALTEKIANSYARFIPSEFLKFLRKDSITDLKLGDFVEDNMTILFSDIRGFTTLSEKMNSYELLQLLNSYFSITSPIIIANSGFIDKFIGDAIMAIFPISPAHALEAAIQLLKALTKFNISREKEVLETFRIGIGMHTGKMTMGTIGSEKRMDTTVVGDTVNLASRLESLTKEFHVPILISESFYENLPDSHKEFIREIDIVTVKGKTKPVKVYEVFSFDSEDVATKKKEGLKNLSKAIQLYQSKNYIEARNLFIKCQKFCPEDSIPVVYIRRCDKLIYDSKNAKEKAIDENIVLIVDDNIAILEYMQFALKKNNYKSIVSINGRDAILKYGELNPKYVLLDLNMPDMDGLTAAEIIKDFANLRNENPLIIFVTSSDDKETVDKILQKGFHYLPKPIQLQELIKKFKNHSSQITIY